LGVETKWTKRVCKSLETVCLAEGISLPIVITPLSASRISQHGIPDRYMTSKVWRGWVEFKGVSTPVTPTQAIFARQQNLVLPYTCFVWRQVDDSLLVKLQYVDGRGITVLGFGDCLEVLRAMGHLLDWNDCNLSKSPHPLKF